MGLGSGVPIPSEGNRVERNRIAKNRVIANYSLEDFELPCGACHESVDIIHLSVARSTINFWANNDIMIIMI